MKIWQAPVGYKELAGVWSPSEMGKYFELIIVSYSYLFTQDMLQLQSLK